MQAGESGHTVPRPQLLRATGRLSWGRHNRWPQTAWQIRARVQNRGLGQARSLPRLRGTSSLRPSFWGPEHTFAGGHVTPVSASNVTRPPPQVCLPCCPLSRHLSLDFGPTVILDAPIPRPRPCTCKDPISKSRRSRRFQTSLWGAAVRSLSAGRSAPAPPFLVRGAAGALAASPPRSVREGADAAAATARAPPGPPRSAGSGAPRGDTAERHSPRPRPGQPRPGAGA